MEKIIPQKHNLKWKDKFSKVRELLSTALGYILIIIHHVGSTAVEDLLAKPIIDIATESTEFPPSQTTINTLFSLGYENKGESGVAGRIWFIKGQPREFNLHFCTLEFR